MLPLIITHQDFSLKTQWVGLDEKLSKISDRAVNSSLLTTCITKSFELNGAQIEDRMKFCFFAVVLLTTSSALAVTVDTKLGKIEGFLSK